MATHVEDSESNAKGTPQAGWLPRLAFGTLFLACGLAIFLFGSYYYDIFPTNKNLTYSLALSGLFLAASLWLKFNPSGNRYWLAAFAFFIASVANPLTALLGNWLWVNAVTSWIPVTVDSSKGLAIDKILEMILKVAPILLLVKVSGRDLGSVFLQRGNLKLGLGIGCLAFFFLAPSAFMFGAQRFTSMEALAAATTWGLVFSFANSFMEEVWLRGVFLRNFAPLVGKHGAVWVTAIVFALMHGFAFYFMPQALPFFVVNTLALGLACGYLMMKSDSLWGPVIIHAGSDLVLFIALLASA